MSDEKKCPACAEDVKAEAKICKHCGYNFITGHVGASATPQQRIVPPEPSGGMGAGKIIGIGCAGLVGLAVLGSIIGGGAATSGGSMAVPTTSPSTPLASGTKAAAPTAVEESGPSLSGPQSNAARSAQQYLNMTGFSRAGLIEQLSSSVGDGYSKADATAAVDSLNVDWNAQAVRSAEQYLKMTGFSCKGLIEQLSASVGDKYTPSQAKYGAEQAGAC